jgi:hypothetical protein
VSSKIFPRFLAAISRLEHPVLVDLGPVIGSNVAFFGARGACKIFIEDVCSDFHRHAREQATANLPTVLDRRFAERAATVDGVLCWDIFDYLDRPAAQALAGRLVQLLKPGGALIGFFGTAEVERSHFTKFVIVDDAHLQHRPYGASNSRTRVMANRDIIRLFDGLDVVESVLLQANTREILFRKR